MNKILLNLFFIGFSLIANAQNSIVTYAGGSGGDAFMEVTQISNGKFLICGYTADLTWIPTSVNKVQISTTPLSGDIIKNANGTNKFAFIMELNNDLQTISNFVYFNANGAEDIRFMKFNSLPYAPTGDLFISGNTLDTKLNNGGYFIAKLNNNFVNGAPTAMLWCKTVWAEGEIKTNHPLDVGSDGKVVYMLGQTHAADWSMVARLNANGQQEVVPNWRTHWNIANSEFKGLSSSYTGASPLSYSGIVLKRPGRCDLRSWTTAEYHQWSTDGNGGMKKGKWPLDFLYNGPCDIAAPTSSGPGYNGYRPSSSQTYGGACVAIDKRNNDMYIGMNTKTVLPDNLPDFEPAVFKMNFNGDLLWHSRLYHEVTPSGDTVRSTPDQYVDALAIDYANDALVVNARAHGNNTENLWEGNTIASNPTASAFQNRFTGTNGNIHYSWLGKLSLNDAVLKSSTYVAELVNQPNLGGTSPYTNPLAGTWPSLNSGWMDVNTTRLIRNGLKANTDGSVIVGGVGRRVFTTTNAHQKMPVPVSTATNNSSWSQFVRIYEPDFSTVNYSSLITGAFDTVAGTNGDNTTIFGLHKATQGILAVGRHNLNTTTNLPSGNNIPVANITPWGSTSPNGESAILVYYKAAQIQNVNDSSFNFISGPFNSELEFIGYKKDGDHFLEWKLKDQSNVDEYTLLMSTDNQNFVPIQSNIAVNPTGRYSHTYTPTNSGNYYYLLQTKFLDGTIKNSNIVNIFHSLPHNILVYPNPAKQSIKLDHMPKQNKTIQLKDLFGRVVAQIICYEENVQLDVAGFTRGIYTLSIDLGKEVINHKIVLE